MAARSIWKGSINFGMVAIPAKLYSSTDDKRVSFHQYHTCGSRVSMPKWCGVCDRKVEATEIKKGYEVAKDQAVILEESDFQALPLRTLKTIEVVQFVDGGKLDSRLFDACYFLTCEDVGAKAFVLFLTAMAKAGLAGIAKLTYREREHLSAIRPYQGVMLLQTLHYADELRDCQEFRPRAVAVSDKELEMAMMLIKAMTGEFELGTWHDDYREALEKVVEAKITGQVISTPEAPAPVSDVAEALLKSLQMAGVKG